MKLKRILKISLVPSEANSKFDDDDQISYLAILKFIEHDDDISLKNDLKSQDFRILACKYSKSMQKKKIFIFDYENLIPLKYENVRIFFYRKSINFNRQNKNFQIPITLYIKNPENDTKIEFLISTKNQKKWIKAEIDFIQLAIYNRLNEIDFDESLFVNPILINHLSNHESVEINQFIDKISEKISNPCFNIIIGDAGSGKTTTLDYIDYYLLKKKKVLSLILTFKDFSIENINNLGDIWLFSILFNKIRELCPNISENEFSDGIKSKKILFLFDALDEYISRFDKIESIDTWEITLRSFLESYKASITITCRTSLLRSKTSFRNFANNKNYQDYIYELKEWNNQKILEWIKKNKNTVNQEFQQSSHWDLFKRIESINTLIDLCKSPNLLHYTLIVFNNIIEKYETITRNEIYDELINMRIEENLKKIPRNSDIREIFEFITVRKILQIIALEYISQKKSFNLYCVDYKNSILNKREFMLIEKCEPSRLNYYIRNNSLLDVDQNFCIFKHQTFAEFLIAEFIYKNLLQKYIGTLKKLEYFNPKFITAECLQFIYDMIQEGKIKENGFENVNHQKLLKIQDFEDFFVMESTMDLMKEVLKWIYNNKNNYDFKIDILNESVEDLIRNDEIESSEFFNKIIAKYLIFIIKLKQNNIIQKEESIWTKLHNKLYRFCLENPSHKVVIILRQVFSFMRLFIEYDLDKEIKKIIFQEAKKIAKIIVSDENKNLDINYASSLYNQLTYMAFHINEDPSDVGLKAARLYQQLIKSFDKGIKRLTKSQALETQAWHTFWGKEYEKSAEIYEDLYEYEKKHNPEGTLQRFMLYMAALSYDKNEDKIRSSERYYKLAMSILETQTYSLFALDLLKRVESLIERNIELFEDVIRKKEKLKKILSKQKKNCKKKARLVCNEFDMIAADILVDFLLKQKICPVFDFPKNKKDLLLNEQNYEYNLIFGSSKAIRTGTYSKRIFEGQTKYNILLESNIRYENVWFIEKNENLYFLIAGNTSDTTIKAVHRFISGNYIK